MNNNKLKVYEDESEFIELSENDIKKIDSLDKNTPFYNQTNESLDGFAKWNPDFDSQK